MAFRGFIAVDIEGSMLSSLADAVKGCDAKLKVVGLENIHLTLKFLGDTDEGLVQDISSIMMECVQGIEPFTIRIQDVGAFPNMNYIKVVWAGVKGGEPLISISQRLNDALSHFGFKKDKKRFSPHVTVARVKFIKDKKDFVQTLEGFKDRSFGEQAVDRIYLKKSLLTPQGPIYSVVSEVPLG